MKKAVVVGGGFTGCTFSYMLKQKGFDVTVVEADSVIGGGCRTYFYHGHPYTNGPHHLLINLEDKHLWDYFNRFLTLRKLDHHTLTYVSQDNRFYTYPIHEDEISEMPDAELIRNQLENRGDVKQSTNFEEYWENSVGKTLYNKFINSYSRKMWQIDDNRQIDEFAFSPKGVAIKTGPKGCYEAQKIVAYPVEIDGYNSYFDKCLEGCRVIMNSLVQTFDLDKKRVLVDDEWIGADILVSTASVDSLFNFQYGELKYIGRDFLKIILPVERVTPEPYYFIHYAGAEPYTRVFEYKLLTGYQASDTLIIVETPSFNNKLYPYPIKSEIQKARKYLDQLPENVYSIGRMGKYHYDHMSLIVDECLELIERV